MLTSQVFAIMSGTADEKQVKAICNSADKYLYEKNAGGYRLMFLNNHLKSKNYGMAGALSVYLFIVSSILCFIVYKMTNDNDPDGSKAAAKAEKRRRRRGLL